MDPRTNGHGDDEPRAGEPARPRLPADGRAPRPSSAQSVRAADQLARLEARIRDFHRNLDALDGADTNGDRHARTSAEASALADDLVHRAADAARQAVSGAEAAAPAALSNGDTGQRRRRSDRADGPFTAQRRIDALRPDARASGGDSRPAATPEPTARARPDADQIQQEAERRAERLHRDAAREAAQIRRDAELEMQALWQALEVEVETIQTEISHRVDVLADRMEVVSAEAELIRAEATEAADRLRDEARAEATQIRRDASEDAEELLTLAEREAHAIISEARSQAEALLAEASTRSETIEAETGILRREPTEEEACHRDTAPRSAAERIAEQIRDATATLTRRVSRAVGDPPYPAREIRGPAIVPASIRDVLEGLVSAVSLIERSLNGLVDLLGDSLESEHPDERQHPGGN